jgi:cytochrome c oxidase assembly protein subunit 15
MDGALVPAASKLFVMPNVIENFVDNPTLVQFNHRLGAYIVLGLALWHALASRGTRLARRAWHLFALIGAQAALGVVTLLLVVPLWAGLAHQAMALAVLAYATLHATRG